jgi:hypothetical protein
MQQERPEPPVEPGRPEDPPKVPTEDPKPAGGGTGNPPPPKP